ncbi:hypothetical protein RFI_31297 [Reticulomyxa filosa]|uniref:Uncharacterized protein n=1 Tax=Reticulomyxa filosa TaxID=46433 RepID=X6LY65_RETFI|nr:hypothetical protein RFI_31297 [Reticulomyxa filosa]|eukprot:ETO06097.1 hypothetical protein RFI_31297 [Reticulomyxa filosa]
MELETKLKNEIQSNESEQKYNNQNQDILNEKKRVLTNELILFGHGLWRYTSGKTLNIALSDEGVVTDSIKSVRIINCMDPATANVLKKEIIQWIKKQRTKNISRVEFFNTSKLRATNRINKTNNYNKNNYNDRRNILKMRNSALHNMRYHNVQGFPNRYNRYNYRKRYGRYHREANNWQHRQYAQPYWRKINHNNNTRYTYNNHWEDNNMINNRCEKNKRIRSPYQQKENDQKRQTNQDSQQQNEENTNIHINTNRKINDQNTDNIYGNKRGSISSDIHDERQKNFQDIDEDAYMKN